MPEKQINEMLTKSLQNLNFLIDSSKVVGKPISLDDGKMIIPLSKITFGFGVGGSEFSTKKDKIITNNLIESEEYPFGGGTLGGVNVVPIAFIIIDNNSQKMIKVEQNDNLFDRVLDLIIAFLKKNNEIKKK
jgi:sporulation protein YtfJ